MRLRMTARRCAASVELSRGERWADAWLLLRRADEVVVDLRGADREASGGVSGCGGQCVYG